MKLYARHLRMIINQNFWLKLEALWRCVCAFPLFYYLIKHSSFCLPFWMNMEYLSFYLGTFRFTHSSHKPNNCFTHARSNRYECYTCRKPQTPFCFSRISLGPPEFSIHSLKFQNRSIESLKQFSCLRHKHAIALRMTLYFLIRQLQLEAPSTT